MGSVSRTTLHGILHVFYTELIPPPSSPLLFTPPGETMVEAFCSTLREWSISLHRVRSVTHDHCSTMHRFLRCLREKVPALADVATLPCFADVCNAVIRKVLGSAAVKRKMRVLRQLLCWAGKLTAADVGDAEGHRRASTKVRNSASFTPEPSGRVSRPHAP